MSKKITTKSFINKCNNIGLDGFILNDTISFGGMNGETSMTCSNCGFIVTRGSETFIYGSVKCPICNGGSIGSGRDDEWKDRFQYNKLDIYKKFIWDNFTFINSTTKSEVGCITCGYIWETLPTNLYQNPRNCPVCSQMKQTLNDGFSVDRFIESSINIHGCVYDYSKVEYINARIKVRIICPVHGEFLQTPDKHINRGHGCPLCKSSNGERDVHRWLTDNDIKHDVEYTYDGLVGVGGGLLRYDFYLPESNTCIEFDGDQHYDPDHYLNTIGYGYDVLHEHDIRKNEYCDKHNIRLIRISEDDDINNVLYHSLVNSKSS